MSTESSLKKDWEPTPEAFEKMLKWLDADSETAGKKYEKIRQKLIKLFKWRNCQPEEEYADITINRVTRRVYEGADIDVKKPYLYFHGTALNVIREYWRKQQKHKSEDIEKFPTLESEENNPEQQIDQDFEEQKAKEKFDCMRECLSKLPKDKRELITNYHHGERIKDVRKALAEKMGVKMNVLRIRACRIRTSLQNCAEKCVQKKM